MKSRSQRSEPHTWAAVDHAHVDDTVDDTSGGTGAGGALRHRAGVTDGIEFALDQAKEAAGDQDVKLSGGADIAQQYLAAGLIDELELPVVPVLLGSGERLLDDVGDLELEQVRAVEAPGVTQLKYRVVK